MLCIHYCTWTLRQERGAGTSLTVTDQSFTKQNMFLGKHEVSWFWFGFRNRCHVISRMNAVFRMWLNCPERFSPSPSEYNEVIIGLICFFCSVKQMCGSSAACQCPAGPDYCPRDAFRAHGKHPCTTPQIQDLQIHAMKRYFYRPDLTRESQFSKEAHFLFCLQALFCCKYKIKHNFLSTWHHHIQVSH